MRSSISSDRARSFTFRTVGAYYSNVMLAVWPPLALRSYGEGANMAKRAVIWSSSRVKQVTPPPLAFWFMAILWRYKAYSRLDGALSRVYGTILPAQSM